MSMMMAKPRQLWDAANAGCCLDPRLVGLVCRKGSQLQASLFDNIMYLGKANHPVQFANIAFTLLKKVI